MASIINQNQSILGGTNQNSPLEDAEEIHMGAWYNYLKNLQPIITNRVDPLRVMAFLLRERTGFIQGNYIDSNGNINPNGYAWNPFQIGTTAGNLQRSNIPGCLPETWGDFQDELSCFIQFAQDKALETQSPISEDATNPMTFGKPENPLNINTNAYYFGQLAFAYNGFLESPYYQDEFCYGEYNQNIRYGADM